jgi:hypothetical protein
MQTKAQDPKGDEMRRTTTRLLAGCLLLTALSWASASFGLDASRINDIRRAETSERLGALAERFLREDSTRRPRDFEEGTQIATEAAAYLLYIQVRQNDLMLNKLQEILEGQN